MALSHAIDASRRLVISRASGQLTVAERSPRCTAIPATGGDDSQLVAMQSLVELGVTTRGEVWMFRSSQPVAPSAAGIVVTPDGKSAVRRNVRLGRRNPDFVEVVDGLKPGEKVIISGYEAYLKMDRVEFSSSNSNP